MGELLPAETAENVVRSVRATVGDELRSIAYFTEDECEQLYLRADLDRAADLASFADAEWADFETTRDAYRDSELGGFRYTIRVFENGFLLRVAREDAGVFVTTDGLTLRDFREAAAALDDLLAEAA